MWGVVTRRRKLAFAPGSSYWHGPDVEVRTAGPSTELRHTVDPGGEVEFGASIRNPGPWPVVITDVALAEGPQEQYAFKVTRVTMIYSDAPRQHRWTVRDRRPPA